MHLCVTLQTMARPVRGWISSVPLQSACSGMMHVCNLRHHQINRAFRGAIALSWPGIRVGRGPNFRLGFVDQTPGSDPETDELDQIQLAVLGAIVQADEGIVIADGRDLPWKLAEACFGTAKSKNFAETAFQPLLSKIYRNRWGNTSDRPAALFCFTSHPSGSTAACLQHQSTQRRWEEVAVSMAKVLAFSDIGKASKGGLLTSIKAHRLRVLTLTLTDRWTCRSPSA